MHVIKIVPMQILYNIIGNFYVLKIIRVTINLVEQISQTDRSIHKNLLFTTLTLL